MPHPEATDRIHAGQRIEELETLLKERLGRQVRDLQVLSTEKGLVLRGTARSYYVKQLAQEALLERTPLPIFANEIAVDPITR